MSRAGGEGVLAPGHRLDGYELLCPIGEGGMASVWVARLTRKHGFEKLVAIKTILPKFAEDESFQKMFLDEARIASRIDHTNVCHIHDLGENNGVLYLVMEYVDGDALTRLRKVLQKKSVPFPIGIALRILGDTCAGLHAAHELKEADGKSLGVVHRDVSPQNVLISVDGVSKVIDFGVAKAAGRLTEETHTGYVKGKVQYMAPEQALGKSVDRRADVWAVGAVLYHLIANRPPFEAENQLALLSLLQRARPPAPLPPSVPAPVVDLIKRSLTHTPAQRFQTAAEMKAAIEKTGLAATTEEVATFLAEHLGELATRRKQAIAQAVQTADARTPVSQPSISAIVAPGADSTQRIDPQYLPQLPPPQAYARSNVPTGRNPPPDPSLVGPPTPQSFPVHSASNPRAVDPRLMTMPLGMPAVAAPPPHAPAPAPLPPSQPQMPVNPYVPTEPLPPSEAVEAGLSENTNGGSLGLGSISSSIKVRRPKMVPWLPIGIGAAIALVLLIGVGLGMRGRSDKKLESQFSPLPSGSSAVLASPTPVQTPAVTAIPTPAPTPTQAPLPTPVIELSATAAPSSSEAPKPAVSGFKPIPAPVGSGRKKPRVDDGF